MANLILPSGTRQPAPLQMVTAENESEWVKPHPIHPTFKVLLAVVDQLNPELKRMKMQTDFSAPRDEHDHQTRTHRDYGVFEARFDHWTIAINWTEEKRRNLPPDYFGVDFGDSSAGIIGPNADIRTCWKCGLSGYRDKARTQPCVVPSRPCPNCRQPDWWAVFVTQDNLVAAAAEALQDAIPHKPYLWDAFGGRDVELRAQGLKAGAWQL